MGCTIMLTPTCHILGMNARVLHPATPVALHPVVSLLSKVKKAAWCLILRSGTAKCGRIGASMPEAVA